MDRIRIFFLKLILLIISCFWISGCSGEGGSKVDSFLGVRPEEVFVEVPVDLAVAITTPNVDTRRVGYLIKVSGTCTAAGKTIEITGHANQLVVCSLGNTWEANISFASAPVGTVTMYATLVDGARKSATVSRSFLKTSQACDTEAARLGTYANSSSGGDGGATPWTICTATQLSNIRLNPTHNFELRNDIDLEGVPWTPLPQTVEGTIEGNQFFISNLSINDTSNDERALIQRVVNNGVVQNLTLLNVDVRGRNQVGALVGRVYNNGSFSNIRITGRVEGNNNVGALTGYVQAAAGNTNSFSNITIETNVYGVSAAGGLFAQTSDSTGTITVSDFSMNGEVIANGSVGGLVGNFDTPNVTIANATSRGAVSATSAAYAGGLVGRLDGGSVSDSYSTSTVVSSYNTNNGYVGGLIGHAGSGATLSNSYSTGNVSSKSERTGGLIGSFAGATIYDSYARGNIVIDSNDRSAHYAGGLVGYLVSVDGDIRRSYATGNVTVTGTNNVNGVGGLVGVFNGLNITDSYSNGNVTNGTSGSSTGGFIGSTTATAGVTATITSSHSIGSVTSGGIQVGGFIGYLERAATAATSFSLSNIYATGAVTSTSAGQDVYVGGLVGRMLGQNNAGTMTISDATASGSVTANNRRVGGLIGQIYVEQIGSSVSVSNVSASGNVAVSSNGFTVLYVGGLIGVLSSNNTAGSVTLNNAVASGDVSAAGSDVGGLVGYAGAGNDVTYNLTNSRATGAINNTTGNAGGLIGNVGNIGSNASMTIQSSYATGAVSSSGNNVGGFIGNVAAVGTASAFTINTTYATGAVTASGNNVGGLVGSYQPSANAATALISGSYATGNVLTAGSSVGGLVGYFGTGTAVTQTISSSYARGSVTSTAGGFVGGLVGQTRTRSTIQNSYASGNVSGAGDYAGGLIGSSDQTAQSITGSFSTGNVVATGTGRFVGGLAGRFDSSTMSNSFATGNVTGVRDVGGLIGYMNTATVGAVDTVYFVGRVYRSSGVQTSFGPLVGTLNAANRFGPGCFWNSNLVSVIDIPSGNAITPTANGNALSLTTTQMNDQGNYAGNFTGYTFGMASGNWAAPTGTLILPGHTVVYTFPVLRWML